MTISGRPALPRGWWTPLARYLPGIQLGTWIELLRKVRFSIDPPYWPRALLLSAFSIVNSVLSRIEERGFGAAVRRTPITEPPVFILGHWRSGTTFLYHLMCKDSARFAFANTFQVLFPSTFLFTERLLRKPLALLAPRYRPMDGVPLGLDTPNEDEFALCVSSLISPFLGVVFPRLEEEFAAHLTLRDLPEAGLRRWKAALFEFCQKLTLLHGRRLLLKSPPHLGRIRHLLALFPEARFIHIHRNPYHVYLSYLHYFEQAPGYTCLQHPQPEKVSERILARYTTLYDAYFEDLPRIPKGHLHEVAFEDLEADPTGTIARIYDSLGLQGFEAFQPTLKQEVGRLGVYRKNRHPELSPEICRKVANAWKRSFDVWGYPVS